MSSPFDFDAIVVGSGLSGLYMLHRLRGLGMSARVFEAAPAEGGTWVSLQLWHRDWFGRVLTSFRTVPGLGSGFAFRQLFIC